MASNVVIISHKYASALLEQSKENRCAAVVAAQLFQLYSKISSASVIKVALNNPTKSRQEKLALLAKMLPKSPHQIVQNFMNLLLFHNRVPILLEIIQAFLVLQAIHDGAVPVKIVTSQPLSQAERLTLLEKFERAFKAQVLPSYRLQPEILGGMKVYVGSYLIDNSWARRLVLLTRCMEGRAG